MDAATVSDTLEMDYEPNSRESDWIASNGLLSAFYYGNAYEDRRVDNRTAVPFGASTSPTEFGYSFQLLRCAASHTGSGSSRPSVMWVKNGEEVMHDGTKVNITNTDIDPGSGTASVLTVGDFQVEDIGTYQCIFNISQMNGTREMITSVPFRLDGGEFI